jgi:acyl dehydratase
MREGDNLPQRRLTVTAPPMHTIAGVLRDRNPIHLDPAAAAVAGLGDRVINQGPANLAYVIEMLRIAFPTHRLASLDSSFLSSVRAGDEVEAGGVIREKTGELYVCDAWLRIVDGPIALKVIATMTHARDGKATRSQPAAALTGNKDRSE